MAQPDASHPVDALWTPEFLTWLLLSGEALAIVLTLSASTDDRMVHFGLTSLVVQWTSLTALMLMMPFRRRLRRESPRRLAYVALACLLLSSLLVSSLSWTMFRGIWPREGESMGSYCLDLVSLTLVVGLFGVLGFDNHWRARQLAVAAKQLEVDGLHERIQPHFLFNTLNTAISLLGEGPAKAEKVLLDLSDLFRTSLRGQHGIQLREELQMARRYLDIESLRMGPRLQVDWSVPDTLPDLVVPALSIQPLLEEAVRDGVEPFLTGGRIGVRVSSERGNVVVVIENDHPGAAGPTPIRPRNGLESVRRRLEDLAQGRNRVESIDGPDRRIVTLSLET